MICTLCHTTISLFDLDAEGVGGMPAHETCASAYRAEADAVLAEVTQLILSEHDARRHRQGVTPSV